MSSRTEPGSDDDLGILRNRTFEEIAVGDTECIERALSAQDVSPP